MTRETSISSGFKRKYYWWDMVVVLKRVVFGMLSQFILSNFASYFKTVIVAISLFLFFAVDVLVEPYQFGNMTKHSWNFASILLLLCQSFVFEREDESSTVFMLLCFGLLAFCFISSSFQIVNEFKNRKKVRISRFAFDQLSDPTKQDVYIIYGECQMTRRGEFEVDLAGFSRWNEGDVSIQTLWQARRLCDVFYDSGFISPMFAVLTQKLDITKMSTMKVLVSPAKCC
jgi:hypothetical protein